MENIIENDYLTKILNNFRKLSILERKIIFAEFEEEIFEYTKENSIKKMTVEEYNEKLNEAELAYKAGNYLNQKDLEKEIEKWIKKRMNCYGLSRQLTI